MGPSATQTSVSQPIRAKIGKVSSSQNGKRKSSPAIIATPMADNHAAGSDLKARPIWNIVVSREIARSANIAMATNGTPRPCE